MGILDSVTTEPKVQGSVTTLTGLNGVGKTEVIARASLAKKLLFNLESGANHLALPKIDADKIKTFSALRKAFTELANTKHDYTLIGVDTMDIVEHLATQELLDEHSGKSIETVGGGFGKGYVFLREKIRDFMGDCRVLAEKGIDVFLLAHTQVKTYSDPTNSAQYDRYVMRCNDKVASIIKDLSDNVFFATYKVYVTEAESGKTKAVGDGQRVMFTEWRPAFDAKNRQSLPFELPLSYDAYKTASLSKYAPSAQELEESIGQMLPAIKDGALAEKVHMSVKDAKGDVTKLVAIKARLQTLITK